MGKKIMSLVNIIIDSSNGLHFNAMITEKQANKVIAFISELRESVTKRKED
jgi:hypothetical protein